MCVIVCVQSLDKQETSVCAVCLLDSFGKGTVGAANMHLLIPDCCFIIILSNMMKICDFILRFVPRAS